MIRRLGRDRRGSVTILMAGIIVGLLGVTGLAVDVGGAYLKARSLQGTADAAALAAAGNPAAAQAAAVAAVRDNGWGGAAVQVQQGQYARDVAVPLAARFTAGNTQPNAARVTVSGEASLRFARALFGQSSVRITRRATAMRINQASFSIGTRLASLQGGVANALIGQLIGGSLNLSVASYSALLGANVDLFTTLDALRSRLSLTGASYGQVLAANVTVPVLLRSIADALGQGGQGAAAAALNQIANSAAARPLQTSRLIGLGSYGARMTAGGVQIGMSAWDLAQAAIGLAGGPRQVTVNVSTLPGLSGLLNTNLYFATGERAAQSPWLTVTSSTSAVVRTAQSRLYLSTRVSVAGLQALGLGTPVDLPIYVELASAEARLSSISCPTSATAEARLAVTAGGGHLALRKVANPATALADFTRPVSESRATLADLALVKLYANGRIDLGGNTPQQLTFTRADVNAGTLRSVSTLDLAGGIVLSLVRYPGMISADLLGIPLNLDAIVNLLANALTPTAGLLDEVLNSVMGLVGLHIGQVDVRMNGISCGQPILVA
ncbi:pilus assembly protein TadG-related protein [Sphingomonas quercus]|uniref:Putative Flp pilus-assembly TadG-like N-terminal domain-containing protein n=1 Tax=Sphingomonas quercus TaxID=2842451 RepID=A0ABS6BE70_9SPHN|nr:pilus assembly protein TadG-related protein [Sphingomonas quercus]MBU3076620.1 hypothetical protein [Sphingomonas quercus]